MYSIPVYVYMCVSTCMHTYVYMYTYIYPYTHIYVYSRHFFMHMLVYVYLCIYKTSVYYRVGTQALSTSYLYSINLIRKQTWKYFWGYGLKVGG